MKESLLQYIWQYQYFNSRDLRVSTGEVVQVLSPGALNTHQGPDFLDARIKIGETGWAGAVELHVRTSDWERHAHQSDDNYRNVILHVVWVDDRTADVCVGERRIPTLALEALVPKWLLRQYAVWMESRGFVACQQQAAQVDASVWDEWKEQLMEERLLRRARSIADCLTLHHQNLEETCWWLMARTFGGPVNGAAFEVIARSLPRTLIARQGEAGGVLEALLLGQAGFLEQNLRDEYPRQLQREFRHLRAKFKLPVLSVPMHFLRMRPGNFPTIRLVQLAKLLEGHSAWFVQAKEAVTPDALRSCMDVSAGGYWNDHYIPDQPSVRRVKRLGEALKDSLLINVFIPMLYAYGYSRNEPEYCSKALRWLVGLDAEKNAVTGGWVRMGIGCRHAGDSQALLELKGRYCDVKSCLQCAIGKNLLGSAGTAVKPAGRPYPN